MMLGRRGEMKAWNRDNTRREGAYDAKNMQNELLVRSHTNPSESSTQAFSEWHVRVQQYPALSVKRIDWESSMLAGRQMVRCAAWHTAMVRTALLHFQSRSMTTPPCGTVTV